MSTSTSYKFLGILCFVLSLVAAWLFGRHQGSLLGYELAAEQMSANISSAETPRLAALEKEHAQTLDSLQRMDEEKQVAEARAAALEDALDESLQGSLDNAAELALYRRIAEIEKPPENLVVENISWSETDPNVINFTLIQWRGRDRVTGRVDTFVGIGDIDTDSSQPGADTTSNLMAVRSADFDFRFFQSLTMPVDIMPGSTPDFIEIHVIADENQSKPLVKRVKWKDLAK